MAIDYDALRTGESPTTTPDDGDHTAILTRAALVDTRNGERLVTEWSDAQGRDIVWQSWNRFDTTGMSYTRDLLLALGVDLSSVTDDDALKLELERVTDTMYDVRTTSQMGSGGDRVFVTTYVDGVAMGAQQTIDVPIDTEGLPDVTPPPPVLKAPVAPGAPKPWEDDKVPF